MTIARDDGTSREPALRGVGALACLICFAAIVASGYKAADSAFSDQAAATALVAFNVYLLPGIVSTYGLVEALKQAFDGENRLWHVGLSLLAALIVVAGSSWLIGLAD
jgi:TRAP-type C4-dicarboxylate transport system permease small subunit